MNTYLKTYNEKIDFFIKTCFKNLKKDNVDIIISAKKYVIYPGDNEQCNGYFTEYNGKDKMFAVATGNSTQQWFEVFVHEYCHFEQYLDRISLWNMKVDEDMWNWMNHNKEFKKYEIKKIINAMRDLEWDCERRVIKKIKEFNLPIDAKFYAKKALAYVTFYDYMLKYRKWYKIGKEPYRNKSILKIMPENISRKPKLTPELERLFKKCT